MSTTLISYTFTNTTVSNFNGTLPITFAGATVTGFAPATTDSAGTTYNRSLNLGAVATGQVVVASALPGPYPEFTARIHFRFSSVFTGTCVLVDCNRKSF